MFILQKIVQREDDTENDFKQEPRWRLTVVLKYFGSEATKNADRRKSAGIRFSN